MELENKLKKTRKLVKFTQLELAKKVGVSRQSIYAIETKKSEPSLVLALKMAKALEVPLEELFWLKDSGKNSLEDEGISPFTIF